MALNRYELPVSYGSPGEPVVRLRAIHKVFHTAAGEATVLKDVNVDIRQGEFVSVVGRSGSGKSTLVNMLTGIDHPTSGTIDVGGLRLNGMPESRMAVWRGKNLGIVFQFFQLLPMLTLVENVMLPMDFCNIYPPASRETRALELLDKVGLKDLAHKLPGAIAGGQVQSAAVARALANDPPILIADEPTGNLDSHTAAQVMAIFEELSAQGKTILMVTHDRSLARRTDRTIIISDGELVDETISAAFPDLPHPVLLRLTKLAGRIQLAPGSPLPEQPAGSPPLVFVVESGKLLTGGPGASPYLPGQIIVPSSAPGDIRAGARGAGILVLPRDMVLAQIPAAVQPPASPTATARPAATPLFSGWLRRPRRSR